MPDYVTDCIQQSTKEDVRIIVKTAPGTDLMQKNIIEDMKLFTKVSTTQMHLFDDDNTLIRYENTGQIIAKHASVRIETYQKRLQYQIAQAEIDVEIYMNKARFVQEIVNKTIVLTNKKKEELRSTLRDMKYYEHNNFDYLLDMKIFSITIDEVEKLTSAAQNMKNKLDELKRTTPQSVWLKEIDELEQAYNTYIQQKQVSTSVKKPKKRRCSIVNE